MVAPAERSRNQTEMHYKTKDEWASKLRVKGKDCTNENKQARSYEKGRETDIQSSATGHDARVKCKIRGHVKDLCDVKYQTNGSPSAMCDNEGGKSTRSGNRTRER